MIGYSTIGTGKEGVIVLEGWFGDCSAFDPVMSFLDQETFTYAFMDYRGYGKSRNLEGNHTMQEIAQDAFDLASHLDWEKFHVIGHSMGGMAMMRMAANNLKRIKSGVALCAVPPSGVPMDEDTQSLFSGAIDNDNNRRTIIHYTTGNRLCDRWVNWRVEESRATTSNDAFADYLTAWTKTDFLDDTMGLEFPLMVCTGEHDMALGPEVMKETYMKWYPQATLEVIANAGHYPMHETPVYMVTLVEQFIRQHID